MQAKATPGIPLARAFHWAHDGLPQHRVQDLRRPCRGGIRRPRGTMPEALLAVRGR